MSTHSTIGYETLDGGYLGVYCHYDGYVDYMAPILHRMFHADVVILVNKALCGDGIRCLNEDGTYEIFEATTRPIAAQTNWPATNEEYAYRKCVDGRVEWTDDGEHWETWEPDVP